MKSMRVALVGFSFALTSLAIGCGGGTPQPKDSDDTTPVAKASGDRHDDAPASAAAAPSEPAPAPAATSDSKDKGSDAKPAAEDDVWMASHQMPPGDVIKTLRAAQGKVHGCFRAGAKRDPSTSGEVKIRFVVTHEGAVRAWRDDGSSMSDEEVTKCVGELVKGLKFPTQKSPGDAWGVYTANFGM
jgi:hypothetical protein